MERFNTSIKGYNINEVNKFVDETLKEYESMLSKLKERDAKIDELKEEIEKLKLFGYNRTDNIALTYEENLKYKEMARNEASEIINNAKKNASRIVNDALMEAEKVEMRADNLRRNMTVFKRKLRAQLQVQLQNVDDLEDIKLDE